jgi:RimJ/RimL family protein N-acetyltransferase
MCRIEWDGGRSSFIISMKRLILAISLSAMIYADRQSEKPCVVNVFNNLPTLQTERLILRKVQPEDLDDLHEIYSDPEVVRYVSCELDSSKADTKKWLDWRLNNAKEGIPVPWAVVRKDTNEMIALAGFCGLDAKNAAAELMINVKRVHWNQGYAKEVLKTIFQYGFESMGLNRIFSMIHPDNEASIRLHEKLGFLRIGMIPECKYYRGYFRDRIIFTLQKSSYATS